LHHQCIQRIQAGDEQSVSLMRLQRRVVYGHSTEDINLVYDTGRRLLRPAPVITCRSKNTQWFRRLQQSLCRLWSACAHSRRFCDKMLPPRIERLLKRFSLEIRYHDALWVTVPKGPITTAIRARYNIPRGVMCFRAIMNVSILLRCCRML